MNNDSQYLNNDSSIFEASSISFSQNNITANNNQLPSSFNSIIKDIQKIFTDKIKPLRKKFSIDSYEESAREIRNLIKQLRKKYYQKEENSNHSQNYPHTQNIQNLENSQTPTKFILPNSQNQSLLKKSYTYGNSYTNNNINTNSKYSNNMSNIEGNTNIKTDINSGISNKNKNMNMMINESMISQFAVILDEIKSPKGINTIYNIMSEIAFFLMSYDDIYINYENKSAYVTMKLFLRMATLNFIRKINKHDFILCLMNKSCNILCKYNDMQKKDESIKKILTLENKELEKFKNIFNWDLDLINHIQKKIDKEIEKCDLIYKGKKIKEEIDSNKLFNYGKNEINNNSEDEMQLKIKKIKEENNILNDIQMDLGDNYIIFLKDSIRTELEQLNLLINKLSQYENPLIKQKFLDIIIRNKEVFSYINENILLPAIPKNDIKNLNSYPFIQNLSIYLDKYMIVGNKIIDILSISLEQDYLIIKKNLEKFAKNFLDILSKNSCKDEIGDNKNFELFKYEINYYHLSLFSFMVTSKMNNKEYFNRISALISTEAKFEYIRYILNDIEKIKNVEFNYESKKEGKEDEGGAIILFDYENNNKNTISFLLEKKYEKKIEKNNNKKAVNPITNIEFCSILAKKLFRDDPVIIILTIALKYWGIQRSIFKYDFKIRKNPIEVLDDSILLFLIYYFLMHKGLIEPFNKSNEEEYINENNDDNKILSLNEIVSLKKLGELFVEFFWFLHEIIQLAENNVLNKKTTRICLNKKKYYENDLVYKDIELKNKKKISIPIPLKLIYNENIILSSLDINETNILKTECIRALYFLLNKNNEEFFIFEKNQ